MILDDIWVALLKLCGRDICRIYLISQPARIYWQRISLLQYFYAKVYHEDRNKNQNKIKWKGEMFLQYYQYYPHSNVLI